MLYSTISDWWFGWWHGCCRSEYGIREWNKENIRPNSWDIKSYFKGFKYVIRVNPIRTLNDHPMLGSVIKHEIVEQYFYPARALGDHSAYTIARGIHLDGDESEFELYEFGEDAVFIATNNKNDALMIALKYK